MKPRTCFSVILLFSCFTSGVAFAEDKLLHRYDLFDHSSIHLKAPVSWKYEPRLPPRHPLPTIVFKSEAKQAFEILITPLGPPSKNDTLPSLEQIKQLVLKGSEEAQSRAVEKEIQIKELKGATNQGYYFSATDREPEPDGYRYMTQGTMRVGTLILMFTILTNDGQEGVIADALTMLKNSSHVKDNRA